MPSTRLVLAAAILAVVALAAGIYTGLGRSKEQPSASARIDSAQIERLYASRWRNAEGDEQAFEHWRGKTLVLNFWATWCPPCRDEMPGFSRLQDKYGAKGVQFVGIALDTAENVRAFSVNAPVSYPLLIGESAGTEFARKLGNPRLALPYTLVVSPDQSVRLARLGGISERELDDLLRRTSAH